MPGYFFKYVAPKIAKNLTQRRKVKDEAFKSIDEKGKGLSLQKRSEIKKSFSGKASKIFDDASKARKGKMGGGMMGRRMGYKKGAKKFPDLTGDGKVTFADILKGRGVINGKKKSGEEPMRDRMKQPLKRKKP